MEQLCINYGILWTPGEHFLTKIVKNVILFSGLFSSGVQNTKHVVILFRRNVVSSIVRGNKSPNRLYIFKILEKKIFKKLKLFFCKNI